MSAHAAVVADGRNLRDGRQIVHIDCPHCGSDHWVVADGTTLAYVPCGDNRPVLLDGLGVARR